MHPAKSNGPSLSWGTVVSTIGLFVVLFGGQWVLTQQSINTVYTVLADQKTTQTRRDERAEKGIEDINRELGARKDIFRDEFVGRNEFKEFSARILAEFAIMNRQLDVLQQTRPTTGELQAINSYVREQTSRMEERIRAIEQNFLQRNVPSQQQQAPK
jgi:hypothetical protein